jgi:hypothetical protein
VLPGAVPVLVEIALVGDDGIVDTAGGTDHEVVAGAAGAVEVDHQVDPVHLVLEIALHALRRARHARRLIAAERHRQSLGRSQEPRFGAQRGGFTGQWLHLAEIGDVPRALPFGRIDAAVDVDGPGGRGYGGKDKGEQACKAHVGRFRKTFSCVRMATYRGCHR